MLSLSDSQIESAEWPSPAGIAGGPAAALTLAESVPITILRLAGSLPVGKRLPAGDHIHALCHPLLKRMKHAQNALQPQVDCAERDFLALGDHLGRLSSVCEDVVRKGQTLFSLATGQERAEEAVAETMQLLDPPLEYLEKWTGRAALAAESAARAASAAQRLLESEEALMRVMEPLVYIRTLFHIESARLSPDVRQMFAALNAEIESLQDRVREHFAARFRELRQLLAVLRRLETDRLQNQQAIAAESQTARERLNRSFQDLQASIAENLERNAGLGRLVDDLSSGVDRMVVAMQTHDMFAQRIAHVHHAIEVLENDFSVLRESDLEATYRSLPTVAVTAELQAAQVRAANDQLAAAAGSLKSIVDEVLHKVEELDEDCLILRGFQHVTAAASGTIQVLLDSMDHTRSLVRRASAAAEAYFTPLEPLGALADSLAGDMDDAGQRMHRIALNTQLIAVQQGEGTGLEALAGTMAATAGRVSGICETAARGLSELTVNLREAIAGFAALAGQGSALGRMFNESGEVHRQSLHALRNSAFDALLDLGRTSEDARRVASRMRSVDLSVLCDHALPRVEAALLDIAHRLGDVCARLRTGTIDSAELEALKAQYTMRSERLVHEQSLHEVGVADADGFGADIELF